MTRYMIAVCAALIAAPAWAADMATGDEIEAAVSGNTVTGGMSDGSAYSEFYDSDGTIRAADYTGKWTVEDDAMCFDYGEGPGCWNVRIEDGEVTWLSDGEVEGTGTVMQGNPNDY